MANYLPVYILVFLVPIGFLVTAVCSNLYLTRARKPSPSPSTQQPTPTPSNSLTSKLRTLCSFSRCFLHRNTRGNAATNAPEDLEMQSIGSGVPTNDALHRDPEPSPGVDQQQQQQHRAAALASLEKCAPPSPSASTSSFPLPPRPSAPSPPSSTASVGRFYGAPSWAHVDDDDDDVSDEEEKNGAVVPAFQRQVAVHGKNSAFRAHERAPRESTAPRAGAGGKGWTDVSLQ